MNDLSTGQLLLDSARLTARLAVALSFLGAAATFVWIHWSHRGGGVVRARPGAGIRAAAMVSAAVAGLAAAWLTRGEVGRWLPGILEGLVYGFAALTACAAATIGAWAAATLGRNFVLRAVVREGGGLVTDGPFALVRHPFYVALGWLGLAATLALGSLTGSLVFVALYAVAGRWRGRHEERLLAEAYPEEWPAYAARTPAWWPRF